jgi:hypothetical protein
MRLVWTYNCTSKDLTETERTILVNYYILSINSAKKLGYHTTMVCNQNDIGFWDSYVDEVKYCNLYLDSPFWDSYKMYVLTSFRGDYFLIDGDVILHSELPIIETDIAFDYYEILNWTNEYQPTIDTLTDLGIKEIIPFWDNKRIPIINCGVLKINNTIAKLLYIIDWKSFNQFVVDNIDSIDTKYATGVGAQYLLSLIVNEYNLSTTNLTDNLGEYGKYYQHYYGSQKYSTPIVPTDNILLPSSSIKLF